MTFVEDLSVLSRSAAQPDAVVRYGELPEHIADVRYGHNNAARQALVILIHGGFWRPKYDRMHTGPMCEAMAQAGWTNASIEYRRIPGRPDATIDDICTAVTTLQPLIEQHNGQVIVMGHSAGGHLCLYAAAVIRSPLIGALALAPVADLRLAEQLNLGEGACQAFLGVAATQRQELNPVLLPTPTIPVTIVHGLQDQIVPVALGESYQNAHPTSRLVKLDRCGHFAVIDPLSTAWPTVLDELRRFT